MKIKGKLFLGIGMMFVFIIASNLIGLWHSGNIAKDLDEIGHRDFESNLAANNIIEQLNRQNVYVFRALSGISNTQQLSRNLKESDEKIQQNISSLKTYLDDNHSIETINKLQQQLQLQDDAFSTLINSIETSGYDQAKILVESKLEPYNKQCRLTLQEIINQTVEDLKEDKKLADDSITSSNIVVFSILLILIVLSIIIIFWLTKAIVKPINSVVDAAQKLSKGDLNFNLETKSKDETADLIIAINKVKTEVYGIIEELKEVAQSISQGKLDKRTNSSNYSGAFSELAAEYNVSLDAVIRPLNVTAEYIDRLSKGDIPSKITDEYRGDFNEIKNNINQLIDTMNGFINEMVNMSNKHDQGYISERINESRFVGSFREMAKGVNLMVEGHIKVKKMAMACVSQYAIGNFEHTIDRLPNEKAFINEALDTLQKNLISVTNEVSNLIQASIDGKLDTRGNYSLYNGDWKKLVEGVNKLIDAIVSPLNVTAEYIDRISKGDIPPKIVDHYNGDFNEIKNNLNQLIDSLNSFIEDMLHMSKQHDLGFISIFMNDTKYIGSFKNMVRGVNDMVAGHIKVKKMAMAVVSEYALGNFNAKLEQLPNEKAFINDALDTLQANLLKVTSEINDLIHASVEGKLDTRGNSSAYSGDWKKLIEELNVLIDSIVGPLNVAAEYVDRIAHGDIPSMITDNYKGDFNEIKNNINYLINTLNSLNEQTNTIISSIVAGDLNYKGEHTGFSGVWKNLIVSMNTMLEEINKPINNLNHILIKITENDYTVRPDDNGKGIWKELSHSADEVINRLTFVQNLAISISKGDLAYLDDLKKMPQRGLNDKLRPAFLAMMESIKNLLDDTNLLVDSINIGMLSNRMETAHHSGEFAAVASGINNVVEVLINNLNLSLHYLSLVSAGEKLNKLNLDEYNGDFKKVPNTINKLRDFLNSMIEDTQSAANAAVNGKLNQRIDSKKYPGTWNLIVDGFNNTLDVMVEQFMIALDFLEKVSNGDDIQLYEEAKYNGEFRIMITNINRLRNFLYTMIDDTQSTANLTSAGDLSQRIDLSKYPGSWGIITGGINATLDGIIEPLENAIETLEVFATGDMTAVMKGDYKGDHKRLQESINKLSSSLGDLIRQVHTGVTDTAAATLQISETTDKMAAATQEQSAQTEEIASAVEQMSRTINENAQNAIRTSELSRKSGEIAEEGKLVVEQTINKMKDIASVVHQSASNIERLGESSKQIGEIISVIDDIADQTNLLALNAAIEAARAGEQGRGFAVVADEVRKLAERTTEATKQIADMIQGIQKETETAVKVMKEGNTEVEQGITLADEAGNALNMILNSAKDVIMMITQIASASEEQAATSEQLTHNVVTINNTTADNAAQLQDIASATDGLTNLTEKLRDLVEQFKVDTDNIHDKHTLSSKERIKQLLAIN